MASNLSAASPGSLDPCSHAWTVLGLIFSIIANTACEQLSFSLIRAISLGDIAFGGRGAWIRVTFKFRRSLPMKLNLVAFLSFGGGPLYRAQQILSEPYKGEMLRSSFTMIKKGTKIQLGEGEGPTITLENDAVSQYICQTDAIKTLILKDSDWKNIYDQ